MKIVRPYTLKGELLCCLLKLLLFPLHLIKGDQWKRPRQFEENPKTMSFKDVIYFAYKYYFKSSVLPDNVILTEHFKECKSSAIQTTSIKAVTISVGGDLMPYKMINAENCKNLWSDIGDDFFGSDLVFANLETPLVVDEKPSFVPEVMLYDMMFNTDLKTMEVFNGFGQFKKYDVLSIANNHSLDMGLKGLEATIDTLNALGIDSVGAKKQIEDNDFVIKEVNGIKLGFLAYTFSLNQFEAPKNQEWKINLLSLNQVNCDISIIKSQMDACRKSGAEFIICSLHAGNAYQAYPSELTVKLYNDIFEKCGPDVIAGGHPHNLQPWRYYYYKDPVTLNEKKGFAIYSLGDFVAYDIYTWCHLCAYLKIKLVKNEAGEIDFEVDVKTLYMSKVKQQLKLLPLDDSSFNGTLNGELSDIKILYDICKYGTSK